MWNTWPGPEMGGKYGPHPGKSQEVIGFLKNSGMNEPPLEKQFLAHRIRMSEILPWDRKSNLTHAILPRLSRECYIQWLYWNSRTLSPSEVIVTLK